MTTERAFKVNPSHLQRDADLYVRQSTPDSTELRGSAHPHWSISP